MHKHTFYQYFYGGTNPLKFFKLNFYSHFLLLAATKYFEIIATYLLKYTISPAPPIFVLRYRHYVIQFVPCYTSRIPPYVEPTYSIGVNCCPLTRDSLRDPYITLGCSSHILIITTWLF